MAENVFKNPIRCKEIVEMVVDSVNSIKNARRGREEIWDDCYKIYRLIHKHKIYQGRSNIFVPEGFEQVETISPRLLLSVIGNAQYFGVKPRSPQVTEEQAKVVGKIIEVQLERAGFIWRLLNFIRQMTIYGRGRAKFYWRREEGFVTKKVTAPGGLIPERGREIHFSGPFFKTVDPFNLFEDLYAESIGGASGCSFVVEKMFVDESQILKGIKSENPWYRGITEQKLKELPGIEEALDLSPEQRERAMATGVDLASYRPSKRKRHLLYEFWGEYDLDEDGFPEQCVLTVLDKEVLIRAESNPFWHGEIPYLDCPYIPCDGELEGIGVIEPIRYLQYELNDTHNQLMDLKTLILNCMWLIDENAGIRTEDLKMRQGGVIRTNDMNGIQALRPPDFTQAGYNGLALLEKQIKATNAATDPLMGIPTAGRQTATEVASLIREGNVRISIAGRLLKERVLKRLLRMAYSMNQQLLDEEVVVYLGGEPRVVSPNMIYGDLEFEALSLDDLGEREIKQQQLVSFFSIAARYTPQIIPLIIKEIWDGFNFKGTEEIDRALQTMVGPQAPGVGGALGAGVPLGDITSLYDLLKNRGVPGGLGGPGKEVRPK